MVPRPVTLSRRGVTDIQAECAQFCIDRKIDVD